MKDVTAVVEAVNEYGVEHVQKLNANDTAPRNWFGRSVAISADRQILVVGASGDDDGGDTVGSVYIYRQNVGEDTYNPVHIQKLNASDRAASDRFGSAIAISVDKSILIVGAYGVNDGDDMAGAVYIYKQDTGADIYNPDHIQKLAASDRAALNLFGASVSLSSDKSILTVGAYGVNDGGKNTGAVYIYKQDTGADIYNPDHIQKLAASDRAALDLFGTSVAVSADKNMLVVGAYGVDASGTNTGAVYIYQQDVGADTYNPAHAQKLTASDRDTLDLFGASVAISADKSILIVGAYGVDDGGSATGAVYIYQQDTGTDTYNPDHIQKLVASDRSAWDWFGASVSLSVDKSILAVGAIGDDEDDADTGSVYIYNQLSVIEDN